MKCKYCNAPVTLEDEFCPYCGALNEAARKHIQDMRRYGNDYQRTRQNVMENVNRQTKSHTRIIAVLLLAFINILLLAGIIMSGGIRSYLEDRAIRKNWKKHEAVLKQYEEEENYALLGKYYTNNSLYVSKKLDSYNMVSSMALDYNTIQDSIFYIKHPDVKTYNNTNDSVERLSKAVARFYDNLRTQDNDYYKNQFEEPHLSSMKNMERIIQAELKVYCDLTDEDLKQLPEMDQQNMMILIGKRIGIYE